MFYLSLWLCVELRVCYPVLSTFSSSPQETHWAATVDHTNGLTQPCQISTSSHVDQLPAGVLTPQTRDCTCSVAPSEHGFFAAVGKLVGHVSLAQPKLPLKEEKCEDGDSPCLL